MDQTVNTNTRVHDLRPLVEPLLAGAGMGGPFQLDALPSGGNNRVYRVECDGGTAILKHYFCHPDDPRNRLAAEFGFSQFAWAAGVRRLPRPLACDPLHSLGLYEWISGRKLGVGDVTTSHVLEAVAFFREINRNTIAGADLPIASEACFSMAEHLACVDRRLESLLTIDATRPTGRQTADLISSRMLPLWKHIRAKVLAEVVSTGLPLNQPLPDLERCITPSDFGFHNALLADGSPASGALRFIDFEYSGWDDPAKTVCDFFCQPAVPVPREHLEAFIDAAEAMSPLSNRLRDRVALLLPVYELKWCCIMLNEFLPVGEIRRSFALTADDHEVRQARQLQKVDAAVTRLRVQSGA